jgi:hypothetical protein
LKRQAPPKIAAPKEQKNKADLGLLSSVIEKNMGFLRFTNCHLQRPE